jgi:peptidoglycan/xylan/chitin deacetylase (PgdA/CDA1 family)
MHYEISSIWHRLPPDIVAKIERCVAAGCERQSYSGDATIFFRADDIAVPGQQFAHLLDLFSQYRVPLCLAVVPAWLTRPRWLALKQVAKNTASLWCWHQHGWRHVNHEVEGKKQEFGPLRSRDDLEHDIDCGRQRLERVLGKSFYPVFTPPWNRCDPKALDVLEDLGYAAISRSRGSRPPTSSGLPCFYVNVDLHTRKEKAPVAGWHNLFDELQLAIASKHCGIMIHHQRMNQAAFEFLNILLGILVKHKKLNLVHFKEYTTYTQR